MKKLVYFLMTALIMLSAASCDKENKQPQDQDQNQEQEDEQQPEVVNQLPTTVWTATWSHTEMGVSVPLKATIAFEDELVSIVISSMDLRVDQMPAILYGRDKYLFDNTPGKDARVSFTVSFQTSSTFFCIPETTFSGSYNPDSAVLTLQASNKEGTHPFGVQNLDFIKESNLTTLSNPLPATAWTASWSMVSQSDIIIPFKALLSFESTSVNMVIAPEMKLDGIPVIMYGTAPYLFQYPSETERNGNVSFTISTKSSVYFNLPETTFSGVYNPDSNVLTLKVSSESSKVLGKDAIDFVR